MGTIIGRKDEIRQLTDYYNTNVCEIKYSQLPYSITKEEESRIRNRIADFVSETGIRTGILPTMITTFGIRHNAYSSIAQASLTMDDLFE